MILLKKSAMVSTAEKYALEIEIFTFDDSGLRFRVAARKKGVFSSQYASSLEGPTFSTESDEISHSPNACTRGLFFFILITSQYL
ncbi:hypothetical protein [Pseudomonas sp. 31-12]|uniref:hypothetical protein n=1 Tax=Pseudomonas sp. 31-12 TaxID=2201356 RepID=UPI0013A550F5|nr:hypothetical protein [Pseudomonas sp. 31-12]